MSSNKVDLVVYEGGERKVIGEAVVDIDGNYLDVSGVVTDSSYKLYLRGHSDLSLSFSPPRHGVDSDPNHEITEAALLPQEPYKFKGRIPRETT